MLHLCDLVDCRVRGKATKAWGGYVGSVAEWPCMHFGHVEALPWASGGLLVAS